MTLAEEDEFVIANPLFVALMILLETLLAGLPAVPFQRRESDLESALPESA